jgi:preprotein translocase subunit SecB
MRHHIKGIPSLILFKNGAEAARTRARWKPMRSNAGWRHKAFNKRVVQYAPASRRQEAGFLINQGDIMADAQQPVFNIEKLFVKDLSVEVPNAPAIYLEREAPQIDVNMSTESRAWARTCTTPASPSPSPPSWRQDHVPGRMHPGGIFRIQNVPQDQIPMVLGIGCPNIVFPYLRETVSDVVIRAGFPPLLLNPVNFEALFLQQQQAQQQQAAPQTH